MIILPPPSVHASLLRVLEQSLLYGNRRNLAGKRIIHCCALLAAIGRRNEGADKPEKVKERRTGREKGAERVRESIQ